MLCTCSNVVECSKLRSRSIPISRIRPSSIFFRLFSHRKLPDGNLACEHVTKLLNWQSYSVMAFSVDVILPRWRECLLYVNINQFWWVDVKFDFENTLRSFFVTWGLEVIRSDLKWILVLYPKSAFWHGRAYIFANLFFGHFSIHLRSRTIPRSLRLLFWPNPLSGWNSLNFVEYSSLTRMWGISLGIGCLRRMNCLFHEKFPLWP